MNTSMNLEYVNSSGNDILISLPCVSIKQIQSGHANFLVLTKDGQVYAIGDNHFGELGLNHTNHVPKWTLLPFSEPIRQISLYSYYSMFLSYSGNVYVSGDDIAKHSKIYTLRFLYSNPTIKWVKTWFSNAFILCENNELYGLGNNLWNQLVIKFDIIY